MTAGHSLLIGHIVDINYFAMYAPFRPHCTVSLIIPQKYELRQELKRAATQILPFAKRRCPFTN